MATKNYVDLTGLSRYDELIKSYIGTEDAKSIKSLSVSGNTVSFFKTNDASGTAAYTVNLPDVSGFMSKIASATGGKIVTSVTGGEVAESSTAISDLATNAFVGSIPSGATATTVTGYAKEVADSKDSAISSAASAASAAQSDVDALETLVGTIPQTSEATTVIGYVDEQISDLDTASEVTVEEAQTPTTGYLKSYVISQGGTQIGIIDIPKDLVVTSGEIVVNPQGQPAGTYLKLTIANQTTPVFINVADLCDVYTAQSSAAQVQLVISSSNEISATIVAGSIGTTELSSGVNTSLGKADSAVQSISTGATNGTIDVDGTEVSVYGLGSAAYTASTAYDSAGTASSLIAALDATPSQSASTDGLALNLTQVDGVVTSITGSIAANTYDAYGTASSVQTTVIGSSEDEASDNTIYGAKAYAAAYTDSVPTASIEALFS